MAEQGRPILVWLIFVFIMFATAAWLFQVIVVSLAAIPPESGALANEITTASYFMGFVNMALYLTAAIALLMMRKAALYFFIAALCLDFGVVVWNTLIASEVRSDMEMIFGVIGLGITFAICLYVLKLTLTERLA